MVKKEECSIKQLKTLKDLFGCACCENCEENVLFEDLKQEAIKWINEIDNFKKSSEDLQWEELTGKTIEYSKDSIMGLRNWITYFFNIEPKDLEEPK